MNNTNTTPPYNPDVRKVLYTYDADKFAKTIAKIKAKFLPDIKISVLAPDSNGNLVNILESKLSGEKFDALCERAAYTLYEGHYLDLQEIGVGVA